MNSKKEIFTYILDNLSLKIDKRSKITIEKLINALCLPSGRLEDNLKISSPSYCRFIKKHFPNKPFKQPLGFYLLNLFNKKHCYQCDKIKDLDDFHNASKRSDGKQSECKFCKLDNDRTKYAAYYRIKAVERKEFINRQQISKFYSNEIEKFYIHCPKGYHVDHIIPITNEIICGLHVPWNFQYLLAKDNLIKSNKLP
jgi:hypothetical protein